MSRIRVAFMLMTGVVAMAIPHVADAVGRMPAGAIRELQVTGVAGVPASGVAAVALNVTVTEPDAAGYVTVYPCGTPPLASNLNFVLGQTVPNAVIAPVSANGAVCFFASATTHLLADVSGWFPQNPAGFQALTPQRILDTRTETPPSHQTFGPGQYQVGVDIQPGTYRTRSNADGCYWERQKGFSGQFSDIIANDFNTDNVIVTIKPTDVGFEAGSGCPTFTTDLSAITASKTAPFSAGTYQVGIDIAPGVWKASGGNSSCYWERLRGFSGEFSDLIANDFGTVNPIVAIAPTDAGFHPDDDCGTWTKIG